MDKAGKIESVAIPFVDSTPHVNIVFKRIEDVEDRL
jgi:hypothetical protein